MNTTQMKLATIMAAGVVMVGCRKDGPAPVPAQSNNGQNAATRTETVGSTAPGTTTSTTAVKLEFNKLVKNLEHDGRFVEVRGFLGNTLELCQESECAADSKDVCCRKCVAPQRLHASMDDLAVGIELSENGTEIACRGSACDFSENCPNPEGYYSVTGKFHNGGGRPKLDVTKIEPYQLQESCDAEVTVAELRDDSATWLNQKVRVEGTVRRVEDECSKEKCGPYAPCCRTCSASMKLYATSDDSKKGIPLQTPDGKSYGCSGDNCTVDHQCLPGRGGRYCLEGVLIPGSPPALAVDRRVPLRFESAAN